MEIYYNRTTPTKEAMIEEVTRVVKEYDFQMGEGPFIIYFPNSEMASQFRNPVARTVVPYLPALDIVPILIIDTMLVDGVRPTMTGGYVRGVHRITKDIAEARATTTTHRMMTHQLYQTLPDRQPDPPLNLLIRAKLQTGVGEIDPKYQSLDPRLLQLPFGPDNLLAIQGWGSSNISPLLAIICLIELFPKTGYYRLPKAWKNDSVSRYDLEVLEHIKEKYIPFVGEDHLATLANMWNDMLRYPPLDWITTNDIVPQFLEAHRYYLEALDYLDSLGYVAREEPIYNLEPVRAALSVYPHLSRIDNGIHPLYTDAQGRIYQIGETSLVSGMIASLPSEIVAIITTPPSSLPGQILIGAVVEPTKIVTQFPDQTIVPDHKWEQIDQM